MSDTSATLEKLEISEHKTRNWALLGLCGALVLLVQGFFTYVITSTATEMRDTNRTLNELVTNQKVAQTQMDFIKQEVADLQNAKKDAAAVHLAHDTRLNSVEQRLALHDQWMQAHTK
ncbi:hypothetical protein [Hymenobacter baengnokdamensis]|uniref:hypothetical protein n=1 Tax=Hymenobacter baengnokdamensis TaxID=2615203 RepID=UPI0012440041|nr:hypothetical protein [Hymenobacter baengnokdamensis]